jgi:hypothetical protein
LTLYQEFGISELTEEKVKKYLKECARRLLTELADYPSILDPGRYEGKKKEALNVTDVKKRIEMFKSPFFGWSTYSVEGAFLNTRTGELQDELTQIVRVIHRFDSDLAEAKKKEYGRVVQSITSWLLMNYYHRIASPPYGETHIQQFVGEHPFFSVQEIAYIKGNYAAIATEILEWYENCVLFTFGYLAKHFWERVAAAGMREDEIWVTSLLNLGVSVIRPGE